MKEDKKYYTNLLKENGDYDKMCDAVLTFDVSVYNAWLNFVQKIRYIPKRYINCPVSVKLKNDYEISAIHYGEKIIKPNSHILNLFYSFMINYFGQEYSEDLKQYLNNKTAKKVSTIDKITQEIINGKQPE